MSEGTEIGFAEAYEELQRITERLNGDQVSAEELVDLLRRGKGLEAALREHLAEVELQVEAIERGEGVQRFTIASETRDGDGGRAGAKS
jgi:exodeoxyribonuclease VII small subunit